MSEESTTPDLFEPARQQLEAVNRRDMGGLMSLCAPDVAYDTSHSGFDEACAGAERLAEERG
jgi:hypothetical protein